MAEIEFTVTAYPKTVAVNTANVIYGDSVQYSTLWGYVIDFRGWHNGEWGYHSIQPDPIYLTKDDARKEAKVRCNFLQVNHNETERFAYTRETVKVGEEASA